MKTYRLNEKITWQNGYTCTFTDPSTNEIYVGHSPHSPQEARREAIDVFRAQNPCWDKSSITPPSTPNNKIF